MNRSKLDALWHEAEEQSRKEGVMYTRYHFAALVVAVEREACAQVCYWVAAEWKTDSKTAIKCAAAIRARGQA